MVFRPLETVVYHIPRRLALQGVDEVGVEPLIWDLVLDRTTDRILNQHDVFCLRSSDDD